MRIVIDTSTQDGVPTVSSTPGSAVGSEGMAGGAAATLQGSENMKSALNGNQPISAGAPSAELLAAIASVSPIFTAASQMDGGPAPLA